MSQASEGLKVGKRDRFRKMRRAHRGTLGIAEIIGLFVAGLMLLALVVGYLYFQVPAQSHVTTLARDRDQLQQQLRIAVDEFRRVGTIKEQVQIIAASIAKFEDHRLVDRDGGRVARYEDLNQLIHKNSLRNTSGPAYTALEPLTLKPQGQAAPTSTSTANKWQSIYPGIGVNVTVEGQYKDVRHFVQDIEGSKEFVIINAVELERATGS